MRIPIHADIIVGGWVALLALVAPPVAAAQCEYTIPSFTGVSAQDGDGFGWSVSVDGPWLAVGAPLAAGGGNAYLYRLGIPMVETEVPPPFALHGSFGWSVDLAGDWLAVGDPGFHSDRGHVDLFHLQGGSWDHVAQLTGSVAGDNFGYAVSVDNNLLAVGVPGSGNSGTVRIYSIGTDGSLSFEDSLAPTDRTSDAAFGASVSISAGSSVRLAVGAPAHTTSNGAVYAYQRNLLHQWTLQKQLFAPGAAATSNFGASVAIDGSVLIAGAPWDGPGSVQVFRLYSNWTWVQELTATGPLETFGQRVALEGDIAVVGGPHIGGVFRRRGKVHQFRDVGSAWVEQATLVGLVDGGYAGFGVATDGAHVVLGEPFEDEGRAYVHAVRDLDLNVEPASLTLGDSVSFSTCGGVPASPVGLFVVAVNGVPLTQSVLFGAIGTPGTWILNGVHANPNLGNLDLDLVTFALDASGKVVVSNVENLQLH